jgi:hypothetical protein
MDEHESPPESLCRAGRYVSQPTGYLAFVPAPLPPDRPVLVQGDLRVMADVRGINR